MSDSIGFLVSDVSRLLRRRFDEQARAIGVTRPQWRVLTTLNRAEGLTQGALAERLEVEPITLCRMVDRLAEAGLVERRRAAGDRRAWHIYLTPRARPLIEQLAALGADLAVRALDGIAPDAQQQLVAALERLRDNLQNTSMQEAAHG